jgi:hypothetical protein
MKSRTTDRFWKSYKVLPEYIKKEAKKAYNNFFNDPYHPGLHFKRIHSTRPIFSIRITKEYRAVAVQQDNVIIWIWIGSHTEYEKIIKQIRIS